MPRAGFEPARPLEHYVLNVARLPFRHLGNLVSILIDCRTAIGPSTIPSPSIRGGEGGFSACLPAVGRPKRRARPMRAYARAGRSDSPTDDVVRHAFEQQLRLSLGQPRVANLAVARVRLNSRTQPSAGIRFFEISAFLARLSPPSIQARGTRISGYHRHPATPDFQRGAEGGIRTRTSSRTLRPERSASTISPPRQPSFNTNRLSNRYRTKHNPLSLNGRGPVPAPDLIRG